MATQEATVYEMVKKRIASNPKLGELADNIVEATATLATQACTVQAMISDGQEREIDSAMIEVRLLIERVRKLVATLAHLKMEDEEILYMLGKRLGLSRESKSEDSV